MKKSLEDFLDDLSSYDIQSQKELEDKVKEYYEDYSVESWDMDDWNNTLTQSVADYIIVEAKLGKTDIQYGEFIMGNNDAYFSVVISKES